MALIAVAVTALPPPLINRLTHHEPISAQLRQDRAGRPAARRVLGWFGASAALSSLIVLVLVVINVATAMDPAPALLGLFNGEF